MQAFDGSGETSLPDYGDQEALGPARQAGRVTHTRKNVCSLPFAAGNCVAAIPGDYCRLA